MELLDVGHVQQRHLHGHFQYIILEYIPLECGIHLRMPYLVTSHAELTILYSFHLTACVLLDPHSGTLSLFEVIGKSERNLVHEFVVLVT